MCNGELVNEGGGETRMGFHLTPELSELYYPLPNNILLIFSPLIYTFTFWVRK